jgi:ElaB/YqjD/DUF883 family membrane-anchored ribosome-binding protein
MIMAQGGTADFDTVREDITALKKQVSDLLKHTTQAASARAGDLRDLPDRGAEALRDQVRESPLASLAVAFIAGSIVSRLLR